MDADDERDDSVPTSTASSSSSPLTAPGIPSDIPSIVKETLAQYIAKCLMPTNTPQCKPWKSQLSKKGSCQGDHLLKKQALNALDDEDESKWKVRCDIYPLASLMYLYFQSHLRLYFLEFTGMTHLSKFQRYSPIDKKVADAFAEGNGPGPSGQNIHTLYFGEGWRQAVWNHTVLDKMVTEMLDQIKGVKIGSTLPRDVVKAILWDFVRQGLNSWKRGKPHINKGSTGLETTAEIEA
jgi:hypothetical protein